MYKEVCVHACGMNAPVHGYVNNMYIVILGESTECHQCCEGVCEERFVLSQVCVCVWPQGQCMSICEQLCGACGQPSVQFSLGLEPLQPPSNPGAKHTVDIQSIPPFRGFWNHCEPPGGLP